TVTVNGRSLHIEESGTGPDQVLFEAGQGLGRTSWDPVLPLLRDRARLVTYDRSGFGRSARTDAPLTVDELAADLVALADAVVPGRFVLVAHSMGGLVARLAVERLAPRLRGLLLIDPTPETAPSYDAIDQIARRVDRTLALVQPLTRFRPLARLASGNVRQVFPPDTYATMLAEDFVPAGLAQTRREFRAVAAAIPRFRTAPPAPPTCPTILLSADRPRRGGERTHPALQSHQHRWADTLAGGRYEAVDSGHFIQAEQPALVADGVRELLDRG
ncbi:alpha/beta fold hydrolase, partial [Kitasatospora sp. NPDC056531]|uniref:alpha/beta fold hydrolase n=1 Tax=Kitasatospora sp. NPDC056531 TaxID=3345856 RepID=UPI0036921646